MKKYAILGIDQSMVDTGICILTETDYTTASIKTKPDKSLFGDLKRLRYIRDEIKSVLDSIVFDLIVLEGFSYGSKGKKLFAIAGLGYFIRDIIYNDLIEVIVPTPGQLKKFVTGKGNASGKGVIMLKILSKWGVEITNDNQADAYGLAKIGEAYLLDSCKYDYERDVIKVVKQSVNS